MRCKASSVLSHVQHLRTHTVCRWSVQWRSVLIGEYRLGAEPRPANSPCTTWESGWHDRPFETVNVPPSGFCEARQGRSRNARQVVSCNFAVRTSYGAQCAILYSFTSSSKLNASTRRAGAEHVVPAGTAIENLQARTHERTRGVYRYGDVCMGSCQREHRQPYVCRCGCGRCMQCSPLGIPPSGSTIRGASFGTHANRAVLALTMDRRPATDDRRMRMRTRTHRASCAMRRVRCAQRSSAIPRASSRCSAYTETGRRVRGGVHSGIRTRRRAADTWGEGAARAGAAPGASEGLAEV